MKKLPYLLVQILAIFMITLHVSSQENRIVSDFAISYDNSKLSIAYLDGYIDIIEYQTGNIIHTEYLPSYISRVVWDYSGAKIAFILQDDSVQIRETNTWQVIFTIPPRPEGVGVTWRPESNFIYTSYGGMDHPRIIQVWDTNNGVKVQEYNDLGPLVWQPQGNFVASVKIYQVDLLDAQTMSKVATFSLPENDRSDYQVISMSWSKNGSQLAIGYRNSKIRIWDITIYSLVTEISLREPANILTYNQFGTHFYTLMESGQLVSWDTTNWQVIEEKELLYNIVSSEFNSLGNQFVFISPDLNLQFEDLCDISIEENDITKLIDELIISNQIHHINICLTENATYTLTASLPAITGDITIIGNGATINMTGGVQIFNVAETGALTLKDVTISGGNATQGGAIYNAGELNLEGVTLENNSADEGGAIYNAGELVIKDSTLRNNTANLFGGAIYNIGEQMTLEGAIIEDNSAPEGSAVYQPETP